MVGRERFELCRSGGTPVLDPTVISRVLLGLKDIGLPANRAELPAHVIFDARLGRVLRLSRMDSFLQSLKTVDTLPRLC